MAIDKFYKLSEKKALMKMIMCDHSQVPWQRSVTAITKPAVTPKMANRKTRLNKRDFKYHLLFLPKVSISKC